MQRPDASLAAQDGTVAYQLTFKQIGRIYLRSSVAPTLKSNFGWPLWSEIANLPKCLQSPA